MHDDFDPLITSWRLALGADGYADNTVAAYQKAVVDFAVWLDREHPDLAPVDARRDHIRAWVVAVRTRTSSGSARSMLPGVRHFYRWMLDEGETDADPTEGIRTPRANNTRTPTLTDAQIRALLGTCAGRDFVSRRDAAIILAFVDGGLRLAELADLPVDAVDIVARMLFVEGKGSNRSGPRRRAVPLGVKATQAIDRYIRERRKHPYADRPQLWLGGRGRPTLSADGIDAMLKRRAALVGIQGLHPHQFRHSWASAFRRAGGSEGDLMVLGGWNSRQMLDRYGRTEADERAREAYRRRSFGDRL